jgi:hypothetical protein
MDGTYLTREQIAKGLSCRYVQHDERCEFKDVAQAARMTRKGAMGRCRAHAAVGTKDHKKGSGRSWVDR